MPSTRSYHDAVASISRQFNTIWSNRSTPNPTFNPPDRCGAASSVRLPGHRQPFRRADGGRRSCGLRPLKTIRVGGVEIGDAPEPDMGGRAVLRLRRTRGGPVAMAI